MPRQRADRASGDRRDELRREFAEFSRTRDSALRARLVEEHLGLVRYLARRFSNRGESYDDLLQVGSLGLIKAVDRYDPGRGVEFATYATHTVVGELKRHFRDSGWAVRAPRRLQELYLNLSDLIGRLSQELGRSPTIAELAERAGVSEEDVIEALEAGRGYRTASLDASPDDDREGVARSLGADDVELAAAEERVALFPHMATLPAREQAILYMRFYGGMTQSEIAARLGISQMHVSRLLGRSLARLRSLLAGPPAPRHQ